MVAGWLAVYDASDMGYMPDAEVGCERVRRC